MSGKTKLIIIAVFFVALGSAGYVASALDAKKVGEACETYQQSSCTGPDAACLVSTNGKYCSISCKADGDCPAGWKCGAIESETISGKTGQKISTKVMKMCLKP